MIPPAPRPVDPAAQFIEPPPFTDEHERRARVPGRILRAALILAVAALALALSLPLLT